MSIVVVGVEYSAVNSDNRNDYMMMMMLSISITLTEGGVVKYLLISCCALWRTRQ